ncbi:hypothetical protein MAC_08445 [Metarhizium acridum CQMa 102]|uniref:Uncharacterized protein n=1 Tax=Metarhizium acridum (strain CQMa 102) TaxID=655827 RepID=E9EEZ7_METAQ|nr:uncharacterized protein MAC_08445 [Metarhizium acridum CQMa 102]EFY85498.1 hypothetical protein MAC_08445 [Metarhizium acridum CQMa 102]
MATSNRTVCFLSVLIRFELHPSPVDRLVREDGDHEDLCNWSRKRFVELGLQSSNRVSSSSIRRRVFCAQRTVGPGSLAVAYNLPVGRAANGNRRDTVVATGRDILPRAMVLARAVDARACRLQQPASSRAPN